MMLTRQEVEARTGLSRSTIYRLMREAQFPLPVRIGPRAVRWPEAEINDYLGSRPQATGLTKEEKAAWLARRESRAAV
ncbi:MAG: AlpA family phage regulatory protein [Gammaproteobacteria bacterium]|nr:AlpA family phage regulatory protein [Gammaproteobacteria bacterium]